jgi:hypothetical protein
MINDYTVGILMIVLLGVGIYDIFYKND